MHPHWLPHAYHEMWDRPWTKTARHHGPFRETLLHHGFLTPHFTLGEAACHDGTPVPEHMRVHAQNHAFNVEELRHELGDVVLPVLSWYRDPAYNRQIHGASKSRHMSADATDFGEATVRRIGHARFFAAAEKVFANGGVGQYPSGAAHVDSRGYRARWTSF